MKQKGTKYLSVKSSRRRKVHKRKWIPKFREYGHTWALCNRMIWLRFTDNLSVIFWKDVTCLDCLRKGGRS